MPVFIGKIISNTGKNKRRQYLVPGKINYSVAFGFHSVTGLNLGELHESTLALERFAWEVDLC